jgi:hypothetical protein
LVPTPSRTKTVQSKLRFSRWEILGGLMANTTAPMEITIPFGILYSQLARTTQHK